MPKGYQRLAPQATICVKPDWLNSVLSSNTKNREKFMKKSLQRKRPLLDDRSSAIIKRLMDGYFEPWELQVPGGSSAFKDCPVMYSIQHR